MGVSPIRGCHALTHACPIRSSLVWNVFQPPLTLELIIVKMCPGSFFDKGGALPGAVLDESSEQRRRLGFVVSRVRTQISAVVITGIAENLQRCR